ncbi:hypothetical protein EYF80_050877 [Liparis tanakae]|uniref:Uncharacterized protein n=1 Tax=Liparis tanakae TaxID=230148 RepID=A0A4Z2FD98_9TELE|nr:hypothetical protein EYF80_050877 [Liparis tanakae]
MSATFWKASRKAPVTTMVVLKQTDRRTLNSDDRANGPDRDRKPQVPGYRVEKGSDDTKPPRGDARRSESRVSGYDGRGAPPETRSLLRSLACRDEPSRKQGRRRGAEELRFPRLLVNKKWASPGVDESGLAHFGRSPSWTRLQIVLN